MKIITSIIILFLYCSFGQALAQQIISRPFALQDDLASNEVWKIFQDNDGYIWFCTSDGISRYDGNEIVTFRRDSQHQDLLPNNNVVDVKDTGSSIWIATHGGVRIMQKGTLKFSNPLDPRLVSHDIIHLEHLHNEMWAVERTGIIYKCTYEGEVIKEYTLGDNTDTSNTTINSIYIDNHYRLWFLSTSRGLYYYDQENDDVVKLPNQPNCDYLAMYQDYSDHYWISIWGEGLYEYNPNKTENQFIYHHIKNPTTGNDDGYFYSIIRDDYMHYLWLMSYNQLYSMEIDDSGKLHPVELNDSFDTHEMFTRFYKDREGNLWLSSYGEIININFDDTDVCSYPLTQIKKNWGWNTNIVDLAVTDDDFAWIAQDRLGLCIYDFKTEHIQCISKAWNQRFFKSHTKNYLWTLVSNSRVFTLYGMDNGVVSVKRRIDIGSFEPGLSTVKVAVEDPSFTLWALTDQGILACRSDGHIVRMKDNKDFSNSFICHSKGKIWSFSAEGEIERLRLSDDAIESETISHVNIPESDFKVSSIAIDADECIWVISETGRVYRTNSQKTQLERLLADTLLTNAFPMDLECNGVYTYFLSRKGLMRYNRQNESVDQFYAKDINIGMPAFGKALDFDSEGNVYVGGQGKMIRIKGTTLPGQRWDYAPKVTDIRIADRSILYPMPTSSSDSLILKPGTHNIEVLFSNLYFGIRQNPRIAYMLEGIDDSWNTLMHGKNSAFYNKLPKGKYKLFLKHEYMPGHWADATHVLTIIQLPYWYETWWAYTIYLMLFLGFTYLLLSTPFEKKKVKDLISELKHHRLRREVALGSVDTTTDLSAEDKEFIDRISQIVENNLKDPDFSVDDLAASLNISRATLHRRMNAVTSMTPLAFIKSKRISKACQLLVTTQLSIAEIGYEVGFSSPKYFTKCFKESLGMAPKEFILSQSHPPIG